MKFKHNFFACTIIGLTSCANVNTVTGVLEKIEINQPISQVEDTVFFSNAHTVVLESDKNIVIGDMARIYCSDDTLFILNSLKNEVNVVSKKGQHLRTINKQGRGHGEYVQLVDFSYDKDSNRLLFLTAPSAVCTYTTDGAFVSKIDLSDYYSNISVDSSNIYLYHVTYIEGRKCGYTIDAIDKKTGNLSHILPFETEYAPYCSLGNNIFSNHGHCSFVRKFDRNIYDLSQGEIVKSYYLTPDKFTLLPENKDVKYDCSDLLNKCLKENKIYGFSNVVYNGSNLMFSTNLWDIVIKDGLICNRYSSVKNTELGIPMKMFRPLEGYGDYDVCFYLQESEIESLKKLISDKQEVRDKLSRKLVTFMNEIKEPCNPILFLYKFRE